MSDGRSTQCTIQPCNYNVGSVNPLRGSVYYQGYGYHVNGASCVVFIVFFSVSTVAHLIQTLCYSRSLRASWYLLVTILVAGFGEILGWSGRLWSQLSFEWWPSVGGRWGANSQAFVIQICCLIIAPSFFIAANYIILGRLIKFGGARYCHINPRVYTKLFIGADVTSILLQAAGGGISSGDKTSVETLKKGSNIMLSGIVFQLAVILGFFALLIEFHYRYYNSRPVKSHYHPFDYVLCWNRAGRKARDAQLESIFGVSKEDLTVPERRGMISTLVGLYITTTLILIRGIFRTIELSDGWASPLAQNQVLFCVLDGAMVLLAFIVWNFLHPGRCLPHRSDSEPSPITKEKRLATESA